MTKRIFTISMLGLAVVVGPMWGSTCTSSTNPCTAASTSGADTADRTVFNADTLNTTDNVSFSTIDFNSITAGAYNTSGLTVGDFVFTGENSAQNAQDLHVTNLAAWGSQVLDQSQPGGTITITIPVGDNILAFGVDIIDQSGSPFEFSVSVNGGSSMNTAQATGAVPASVFFGYTASAPITSIVIAPIVNDQLAIDNLELGAGPAPTPEVGTLLLIGTGLLLMRLMHRRQKRNEREKPYLNCHETREGSLAFLV